MFPINVLRGWPRLASEPLAQRPQAIFPEVAAIIVLGRRITRGMLRGIEEGSNWNTYELFGRQWLEDQYLASTSFEMVSFLEDLGYEAVPLFAYPPDIPAMGVAVAEGRAAPNVLPEVRAAAAAAGLGEIGWSKVFLHPVYGPRVRIGLLLTDARLEPDPVQEPSICDRCLSCAKGCPGGAIPKDRQARAGIEIEGRKIEWGDTHMGRCTLTHHGLNRAASPFLARDLPHLELDVPSSELIEEEAYKLCYTLALGEWRRSKEFPSGSVVDYYRTIMAHVGYYAICGARGCIRDCMQHLEEKKRIKNLFRNEFRKRPAWKLPAAGG